ncbi:purine-cytosine permease family protein [Sinomonas gamaensis]|uniref:purine-cytosine permease family protein n=1 Tax=Sinomonas gamaensis TaxID=2565624 RepID=UPI001109CD02|nr:cytosine permease [Sinomonas gamaensis]
MTLRPEAETAVESEPARKSAVEHRSIEFIPLDERHGTVRSLFTLWFGANMQITTIAAGAIAISIGVPLPWAIVACILGNLIGAVFMALHSAQGPLLGIPQMIQSRAQFGFYGAVLPIVLVILMYVGYFASSAVLGGQALASWTGLPVDLSIVLVSCVVVVLTVFGYRLMHAAEKWISLLTLVAFGILSVVMFGSNGLGHAWTAGSFEFGPFLLAVAIAATWQLTYAPYVADYSRYLPPSTKVGASFWYTYAGTVISSIWMFILGAVGAATAGDAFQGGSVDFLVGQVGGFSWFFFAVIVVGIVGVQSLNLYGLYMSISTTLNSLFKVRIRFNVRVALILVSAVIATGLAVAGRTNFLDNFTNFILLLAYFLIPWTSINLADFYLVRKEKYSLQAIFDPKGEYGGVDWRSLTAYLVGVAIEVPFVNSDFFQGPMVNLLGGADISWILGIFASGGAYVFLMRKYPARKKYPAAESAEFAAGEVH